MQVIKFIAIIVVAVLSIAAVKPHYGGDVTIRLNEPTSLSFSSTTYSNQIFCSMIYENFFYLSRNGETSSHIFASTESSEDNREWRLELKKVLALSDGSPLTINIVETSLKQFLQKDLASSRKVAKYIREVRTEGDTLIINLLSSVKKLPVLLSAQDLVIITGKDGVFAGQFKPVEWEKGKHIKLIPNIYYPGGRSYLNSVTAIFHNSFYPDVFLTEPGSPGNLRYREIKSGIYQNIYLCFPEGRVGKNTRTAIYTLFKKYLKSSKQKSLGALTSEEESPVTINIPVTSYRRMKSILRSLKSRIYFVTSLKEFEEGVSGYVKKIKLKPITSVVRDDNVSDFVKNNQVDFLVLEKVFNMGAGVDAKVEKVVRELSFNNFNEEYLKLLSELNEIRNLKNEEILLDQVASIIGKVIKEGIVIPLSQKRFALMVSRRLNGIESDYFGRPLFHKAGIRRER